ncbi:hypothetical protein [Streptomyces sp. NPDC088812]|uniref:hypothetical protein n=1 Tax=Streptomyces sp. NPDC088812 TaxID=3365905 RepID=UPI003826A55A
MGTSEAGADGLPEEKPGETAGETAGEKSGGKPDGLPAGSPGGKPGEAPPEALVEADGDEGEADGNEGEVAGEAAGEPRPVRRGRRTGALIAGAAVLGLVAGTCTGYLVQADREPTKLPPLSQPAIAQAKGPAPEPLPAAQDRRVKTDGDLRELLLSKPKGARDADWLGDDGWMDMAAYADTYTEPGVIFDDLIGWEFRRAAVTGWEVGSAYTVEIRLVQYRQREALSAEEATHNVQRAEEDDETTDSWTIPGTGDGWAYVHTEPKTEPGYEPVYEAKAYAWRGDIAMQVFASGAEPFEMKTILDLAQRQMERL